MNIFLLIIDAQFDFCNPKGALYVPGAEQDCCRLGNFIMRNSKKLTQIYATLDTHSLYHIAHPLFWKDKNGKPPAAFTTITREDCAIGAYQPYDTKLTGYVRKYLDALQSGGRYQLVIWPPHCLLGSEGWTMDKTVFDAIQCWERETPGQTTDFILKGKNPLTEHYSAIHAEVPLDNDPNTVCNTELINKLEKADIIIIAGEALSHCVANTLKDLFSYISPQKILLLTDCTSSVSGFESNGSAAIAAFTAKGMKVGTSDLVL